MLTPENKTAHQWANEKIKSFLKTNENKFNNHENFWERAKAILRENLQICKHSTEKNKWPT